MIDGNQVWDVSQVISWVQSLQEIKQWFTMEPTAPDAILGRCDPKVLKPHGIGVTMGDYAHGIQAVVTGMLAIAFAYLLPLFSPFNQYLRYKPLMSIKSTLAVLQA
jgi:hypothetical protein